MSERLSKVSWTDYSWGPWRGCSPVAPECLNCYANRQAARYSPDWDFSIVKRTSASDFRRPLRLNKKHTPENPGKVFVCPMGDFFHADADDWRAEAWDIIRECKNLIFIIPTKRPERINDCLPGDWNHGLGLKNVWLGISAGTEKTLSVSWAEFCSVDACVKFLSCEPLLETIPTLLSQLSGNGSGHAFWDWVIVGGESGPGFRPMDTHAAREIRDTCKAAGVPFYFKQHHGSRPGMMPELDGVEHHEFPEIKQCK